MSLILSIETSTRVCSVALHREGILLGFSDIHLEKTHSSLLNKSIRELLENCGVTLKDLIAIAVSKGPGSYTGLRIGVSSAKGFCHALDIPLIGISTLQALALRAIRIHSTPGFLFVPMIDARRMEVFYAIFDSQNKSIRPPVAEIIQEEIFKDYTSEYTLILMGDGVNKCIPLFKGNEKIKIVFDILPSAETLGILAYKKYVDNKFEDVAYFEPFYLKDFLFKKPV